MFLGIFSAYSIAISKIFANFATAYAVRLQINRSRALGRSLKYEKRLLNVSLLGCKESRKFNNIVRSETTVDAFGYGLFYLCAIGASLWYESIIYRTA